LTTPPRAWRRGAFALYACVLFTLTHWPEFGIDTEFGRPDLIAHAVAFATWTILLGACAFFGPARSRRNLLGVGAIAVVYACIDEALQALPIINRHASYQDLGANLLGVGIGLGLIALTSVTTRPNHPR